MSSGSADERSSVEDRWESPLRGFEPGTTVLVSGPPLVGKYDLVLEILADGMNRGEGAIAISTRNEERAVVQDFERVTPEYDPSMLGIVECVTGEHEEVTPPAEGVTVRRASSPADLTGIGIGASELMGDFRDRGCSGVRLGIDSLSTLLLYTEFERMARFLHVLSSRIDRAGGLGLFVINPGTIDAAQYDQLKTLFDGLVEIREREDGRELRIRGLANVEAGWRPYDPHRND